MKSAILFLTAAAWLGAAAAAYAAPLGPISPRILQPLQQPLARQAFAPSRPAPPPSDVHGYIVYKDAAGQLRPSEVYPHVQLRFVRIDSVDSRGQPIVYKVPVFEAAAGLSPVRDSANRIIAWRYSFGLSTDRLARDYLGAQGVERDPERANSVRFNPAIVRYDGFEVSMEERWYDPNLRREDSRGANGVIRPTPYEDEVNFSH